MANMENSELELKQIFNFVCYEFDLKERAMSDPIWKMGRS